MDAAHSPFLDPEKLSLESDPWSRRTIVSGLIAAPEIHQYVDLLESLLLDGDPVVSMLAFQGLRKLSPPPLDVDSAWNELFAESVQLLIRQAQSGPLALRIPAIQALAFAPTALTTGLVDTIVKSFQKTAPEVSLWPTPPTMPLMNYRKAPDLPEGFALLLSSLSSSATRLTLLRRELQGSNRETLLPVFLSLQIFPIADLTHEIMPHTRSPDHLVALEAIRALSACGGPKVFHLVASLFHETSAPAKKARLIDLLVATGREEALAILRQELQSENDEVLQSALAGIGEFPLPSQDKASLLQPYLEHHRPAIQAEAAVRLWKIGSMEALHRLEQLLRDPVGETRSVAAEALGRLPASVGLPALLEQLAVEKSGDAKRHILLALRRSLPRFAQSTSVLDRLLPHVQRFLTSPDIFFRNQAAVLCGYIGRHTQDLLIGALDREENPHVLASLLKSLGRIGSSKVLIFARFLDHPDPRVRGNLMEAFFFSGQEAIPYLTKGLKDPSPRVRASAAFSLFLLGQTEVVGILNRLLLTSSPASALSACYCLSHLFRQFPMLGRPDNLLALSLQRQYRKARSRPAVLPEVDENSLEGLFHGLSCLAGDLHKAITFLQERTQKDPDSHVTRRLLGAFHFSVHQYGKALPLIERCLREHPNVLADQFDCYRLAIALGDMSRAGHFKQAIIKNYTNLLSACQTLCRTLRGQGTEELLERLLKLRNPSMNLYNAMIQLKTLQGEGDTVQELLLELLLARPLNGQIARKMADLLPPSQKNLQLGLFAFADAFGRQPQPERG